MRLLFIFVGVLTGASGLPLLGYAAPASTPPTAARYTLRWADEFSRSGRPDPTRWGYEHGFVRNREDQWYQPQNAWVEDGRLVIEARRERVRNPQFDAASPDWRLHREFAEYTSASLLTRDRFQFRYGRVEMRARFQGQLGVWPAFWTRGVQGHWPSDGEIDILEYYRGQLLANFAWGSDRAGEAVWNGQRWPIDDAWTRQWHVWQMDWDDRRIALFVDGRLVNVMDLQKTVNGKGSPDPADHGRNPFQQPHYLILNLALGGNSGGSLDRTRFPVRYEIDYVRAYEAAPNRSGR